MEARMGRGVIALVVLVACSHEEPPDAPETWSERLVEGWQGSEGG